MYRHGSGRTSTSSRRAGAPLNTRFQQYLDILLADLGLSPYRKLPNLLAEVFAAYRPADYTGVVNEFLTALGEAAHPGRAPHLSRVTSAGFQPGDQNSSDYRFNEERQRRQRALQCRSARKEVGPVCGPIACDGCGSGVPMIWALWTWARWCSKGPITPPDTVRLPSIGGHDGQDPDQYRHDVPADTVLAAITDFSSRRPELWPNIDPAIYKVHDVGTDWADVTEGSRIAGGVWARERYDWSVPGVVRATVRDSNIFKSGFWEMKVSASDGGSHIEIFQDRRAKGFKGLLLGGMMTLMGGRVYRQGLDTTLAILRDQVARGSSPAA